jgi:hypothetical protein
LICSVSLGFKRLSTDSKATVPKRKSFRVRKGLRIWKLRIMLKFMGRICTGYQGTSMGLQIIITPILHEHELVYTMSNGIMIYRVVSFVTVQKFIWLVYYVRIFKGNSLCKISSSLWSRSLAAQVHFETIQYGNSTIHFGQKLI